MGVKSVYTFEKFRSTGTDRIINHGLTKLGVHCKYRWAILRSLKIARHPFRYLNREKEIQPFLKRVQPPLTLPKDVHYKFITAKSLPGLQEVVAHCQKLFKEKSADVEEYYRKNPQEFKAKPFLIGKGGVKGKYYSLQEILPVVTFATKPEIVSMVANYMGEKPVIGDIFLMHTAVNDQTIGPQMYHLDKRFHKRFQIFIAIHDVDEDAGPFTFLPGDVSEAIADRIGYYNERVTDEKMYQQISPEKALKVVGEAGTAVLINASRCFHYGSRSRKKPRLILEIMYTGRFNPLGVGDYQFSKVIRPEDMRLIPDPVGVIH